MFLFIFYDTAVDFRYLSALALVLSRAVLVFESDAAETDKVK